MKGKRLWAFVALVLSVAILVAACGGGEAAGSDVGTDTVPATDIPADGDSDSNASNDGSATSTPAPSGDSSSDGSSADPMAFSSCMRANGVPSFPDPMPSGGFRMDGNIASNPNFEPARIACEHLLPPPEERMGGQADPELVLEFAQCMRENGVPEFPDPQSTGGATMGGNPGIDPSSPQFQYALEICSEQTGLTINVRPSQ